jgi:murein DD-endopeptidase MepM/ murein hydrolase activator NlpD
LDEPITQGFGAYSPDTASMYGYSSDYGWASGTHIGLDVGVPKLTRIYSPVAGEVIQAGPAPYFRPNPVYVLQDNGDVAIFGHLWSDAVTAGQRVGPGTFVGLSGEQTLPGTMTPDGTGPHIHFELRQPDPTTPSGYRAIDPSPELLGATGTLSGDAGTGTLLGFRFGQLADLGSSWQRLFAGIAGIAVLFVALNGLTNGGLVRTVKSTGKKAAILAA